MRARSAAVAMALGLLSLYPLAASADAPTDVEINAFPCTFSDPVTHLEIGIWEATGAITDSGTYVRTGSATSPPDRPLFAPGPYRETFVFTGSQGTFTIAAEERLSIDQVVSGVWQVRPEGTGAYARTSGHGTVAFFFTPLPNGCSGLINHFTFSLTGVASKVGSEPET